MMQLINIRQYIRGVRNAVGILIVLYLPTVYLVNANVDLVMNGIHLKLIAKTTIIGIIYGFL